MFFAKLTGLLNGKANANNQLYWGEVLVNPRHIALVRPTDRYGSEARTRLWLTSGQHIEIRETVEECATLLNEALEIDDGRADPTVAPWPSKKVK